MFFSIPSLPADQRPVPAQKPQSIDSLWSDGTGGGNQIGAKFWEARLWETTRESGLGYLSVCIYIYMVFFFERGRGATPGSDMWGVLLFDGLLRRHVLFIWGAEKELSVLRSTREPSSHVQEQVLGGSVHLKPQLHFVL